MQEPTAHNITHVLINFGLVGEIAFPSSDTILSRKRETGKECGGHLVSKTTHISPPVCVFPRHLVTHVVINLNDDITMRSERMNPLLVCPAILSGNEIVDFTVRAPKRMNRSFANFTSSTRFTMVKLLYRLWITSIVMFALA